jgi:hypothetical protein
MSLSNLTESNDLPVSPTVMCPFLGELYDATTYSANDVVPNYCHKAHPVAPVNIDHQILVCLSEEYKNCLVFTTPNGRPLPIEWLNKEEAGPVGLARWKTPLIIAGIGLVCILLLGVFLLRGRLFGTSTPVAFQDSLTASPTEMLFADTDTPTATETPTILPTDTVTPTLEPTTTATASLDPSSLTQTAVAFLALTQETQTQTTTSTDLCESDWANQLTVKVFDPEYSPKHLDPPLRITYGAMPFLVRWQVQNTSKTCTWNSVKLQTVISNQNVILTLMPADHVQPYIDSEFAMRDNAMTLLNQVQPGQTVIISIQIDGMTLVNSGGAFDKTCNLIVNSHLLPAGSLHANVATWAIVQLPATLTMTPIPRVISTPISSSTALPPTNTALPTAVPTDTAQPTQAPTATTGNPLW